MHKALMGNWRKTSWASLEFNEECYQRQALKSINELISDTLTPETAIAEDLIHPTAGGRYL